MCYYYFLQKMDEMQELYTLTRLYIFRNLLDPSVIEKIVLDIFQSTIYIENFCYQFWKEFGAYIKQKFPDADLNFLKDIMVYYELPDLSKTYDYDEISSTFNAFSEIGKKYHSICNQVNDHNKYFLTEKTYGDCAGNIMISTIFSGKKQYIYENPDKNEYLVYVVHNNQPSLISLNQKIDFDE